MKKKNIPVSSQALKIKALTLIKTIVSVFKAYDGWLKSYMCRCNLVLRAMTSMAQELPKDLKGRIMEFRSQVKRIRDNGDFPYDLIGNMDKTPVYMDMVPSKTVDGKKTEN